MILRSSETEKLKYIIYFICSSTYDFDCFLIIWGDKMGQQEVYDFLCKNRGKWFTSREISEKLKVSIGSVTMSLKKLRKTNIIKYKNTGKRNTFMYKVDKK
jgi:DNA-binding transcriptional regulator GbsR (MarR family)